MTPLALLALGFVLGLRHATDVDHVVAVTTLVTRSRSPRAALALGGLWGVGHSLTLLVVGGAIVAFGLVVPPRLGLSLEMGVALMLIVLGALSVRGASEHRGPSASFGANAAEQNGGSRSLVVGVVHGLAGSAAVALLVLTTQRGLTTALAYLGLFGAGTVAGMMLVTATLTVPIRLAAARFALAELVLARAAGALSIALGLFLAYRIGFVDGLLLGDPTSSPE